MRDIMARASFVNWAGNQRARGLVVHEPRSEDEVVALVHEARARGERVRVVGSGHSWSDAAVPEQHMVRLNRMAGLVRLDRDRRRITVQAGMRLRDVVALLAREGLALTNLGSIAEQTVAGAMATGTHGTGLGHRILASQAVALRIVTGHGRVMALDDERGNDLLDAARVALGALGIITEVTLQCREAFDLEERAWSLPFDEAAASMLELARTHEHFKAWWLPHTGRVQLFAATPSSEAARAGLGKRLARSLDALVNQVGFSAILAVGRAFPRTVPRLNRLVGKTYFREARRIERSDRVFNVAMPPRHLEMEYGLPLEAVPEALARLHHLVERSGLAVNFVQEVRFVAADTAHLSPACGRESCQLGAYMAPSRHSEAFFRGFEQLALELGGRPLWGKMFTAGAADLAARYPKWERWQAIRKELDPHGVFASAFTRRVFGD